MKVWRPGAIGIYVSHRRQLEIGTVPHPVDGPPHFRDTLMLGKRAYAKPGFYFRYSDWVGAERICCDTVAATAASLFNACELDGWGPDHCARVRVAIYDFVRSCACDEADLVDMLTVV